MTTVRTNSFASSVSLEGCLEKKGSTSLTNRKYWCRLNDSKLTYYNVNSKNAAECGSLTIQHIQSVRSGKGTTFEIITQSKTHIFMATENEIRDQWVTAVRDAMSIVNRRASTCSTSTLMSIMSQRSTESDSVFTDPEISSPPIIASNSKLVNGNTTKEIQPSSLASASVTLPQASLPKPWSPPSAGTGTSKVIAPKPIMQGKNIQQCPEQIIAVHNPEMRNPSDIVHFQDARILTEVRTSKSVDVVVVAQNRNPSNTNKTEQTEMNQYDGYINRYDIEKSSTTEKKRLVPTAGTETSNVAPESISQGQNTQQCPDQSSAVYKPKKKKVPTVVHPQGAGISTEIKSSKSVDVVISENRKPSYTNETKQAEMKKYDGYINRYDIYKSLAKEKFDSNDVSAFRETETRQNNIIDIDVEPNIINPVAPPRKLRTNSSTSAADQKISDRKEIVTSRTVQQSNDPEAGARVISTATDLGSRLTSTPKSIPDVPSSIPLTVQKPKIEMVKPIIVSKKPNINGTKTKTVYQNNSDGVSKFINTPPIKEILPVRPVFQPTPAACQDLSSVRTHAATPRIKSPLNPSSNLLISSANNYLEIDVNSTPGLIPCLLHGPREMKRSAFDDIRSLLNFTQGGSSVTLFKPGRAIEDLRLFLINHW